MQCEMCGKVVEQLKPVRIEGVVMQVCPACTKYGEAIRTIPRRMVSGERAPRVAIPDKLEFIDTQFGVRIKEKREKMGMRQKDLARYLNEKESVIHQLESANVRPDQKLMLKLKEKLGLDLLKETSSKSHDVENKSDSTSNKFTLGDYIKK